MEKAAGDIAPAALKTIDDDPELDDLLNSKCYLFAFISQTQYCMPRVRK